MVGARIRRGLSVTQADRAVETVDEEAALARPDPAPRAEPGLGPGSPPAELPGPPLAVSVQPGRSERSVPLAAFVAALVMLASAGLAPSTWLSLTLAMTGAILFAAAGLLALAGLLRRGRRRVALEAVTGFVEGDGSACYLTDALGAIRSRNAAAGARHPDRSLDTLAAALGTQFASPAAVIFRLQAQARAKGVAREDLVTRRGHMRLSVHCLDPDAYLWRVEELSDRGVGRGADALSLPMLTAGPAGTILFMNEAFRRLVGGRPRHLDAVFLDLPLVPGRIHRVRAESGHVDCLLAQIVGAGGRREVYLLPADATDNALSARATWDAIEDLPVPLMKLGRAGDVLAANREARALLPMPIGPGTRLSDLLEGLGRPLIDWLTEVAQGRPSQGPQVLRGTGSHQDTTLRVALSLAGPPGDLHLIAVLQDVSELKALEAQFVQSQKMQALGQLAGGVAHDFNNLLTAISGHCDLLLLRRDRGDPDYGDLQQISQNANRAAALVGQLLAFSRKQSLMPETLDLRDTLADLAHLLNRLVGERVSLVVEHDPALRPVRADKRQLEQVLMNLVVNARDAMPGGGEVRVSTHNRHLAAPLERDRATVPPGDYVVLRVADNGTGIPPDRLPKIFEPFYTTKKPGEGTGLGLSTAYGIIKQTGGYIFADSEVGRGTVFTLWLPAQDAAEPAAPAPQPAAAPAPPRRAEGVVLLVEDEAPVRAFASRALRLRGYTVVEADSAETALAILADPALAVDLFVTDVIMPGKNGPTWVREALASRPDTRVVFVSGYAEEAFAEHKALIPHSRFLPKPFSLTDLTATVDQALAYRARGPAQG